MSSFDEVKAAISGKYDDPNDGLIAQIPSGQPDFSEFGEISSKEQQVIDKINEMSKIISCYKIKKYNAGAEEGGYDKIDPIDDYCVDEYKNFKHKSTDGEEESLQSLFNTKEGELKVLLDNAAADDNGLSQLLNNYVNNRTNLKNTDGSLNVVDGESIEDVLTNYNNLQSNRNKLKTTLSELKSEKGTFSRESELHLDATIYSSILFTTVATGLLYYVFTAL